MQNAQNDQDVQPGHITPRQAAERLRISTTTIRRRALQLGGRKVFGRWQLDLDAVEQVERGVSV